MGGDVVGYLSNDHDLSELRIALSDLHKKHGYVTPPANFNKRYSMIPPELLAKAIAHGTDKQFQDYVRTLPSVLTNDFAEWVHGEGRSVYAHQRSVADGAGMGIKPPYSGVPLTHVQHLKCHNRGQSSEKPPEWWEDKKIQILKNWIRDTSYGKTNNTIQRLQRQTI